MSTSNRPHEHVASDLEEAVEDIETAISDLESDGVFSELSSMEREVLDTSALAAYTSELETALEVTADLLSELIEPGQDSALSLGEILARYVRDGVVEKESVTTADTLLECLGSTGSAPGDQGLSIGEKIRYDSLLQLVEDLRELIDHLTPE
jgi:hypothetical protein